MTHSEAYFGRNMAVFPFWDPEREGGGGGGGDPPLYTIQQTRENPANMTP